jgi:membrane protein DedA with SNARE-associated domain/membrane-associated phospholipid phosphatase
VAAVSPGQVFAAVLAVLIAAGAIWRRRRLGRERTTIALIAAAALGIYASGLLSELPDPKEAIGDIAQALGPWTYVLVGVMAFLETGAFVGLVAPGETVVIAGGVIAGQGEIELIPLIGLVWVCAILGDSTSFYIGRRLGRSFLERHGPRFKITHERLEQVSGYFDRHGGKTILIGRFIGLVRAIAPFIAGSSGLAYRRFLPYSVVGTGLWATVFCVIGYLFWRSFDQVVHLVGQALFGFGITVAVIVGVVAAYRNRQKIRGWLEAHRDDTLVRPLFVVGAPVYRRLISPVARAAAPRIRFVRDRLTPGELGLELTTTLAIGGVGMYVFVLYLVVLSGDPGPTPLDNELLDLNERIRTDTLVDVAKVVTELGAFPTVAALVLATSVLLAIRRRPAELLVLLVGFGLTYLAVQAAKAGIERPRPPDPLMSTQGHAYPSGHAAYSTAWIAVGVVLTRRLGLVGHAALVLGGIAVAAAVGVTRVYLHTHYWSDVAGGWGLGVGIFGTLGVIALVIGHLRHNGRDRASSPAAR